jgi:integrase
MARKLGETRLGNKERRRALPVARKPVFIKIRNRVGLGYRRNQAAGTWVVRVADGKGGNWTKAIGLADDLERANGGTILSFDQAQDLAIKLARGDSTRELPDPSKPATVAQSLDRYEADLMTRGGDIQNVARVRLHLGESLLAVSASQLTAGELRVWRDGLVRKRAPASVNRVTTGLKAALNLAAEHDARITSRRAWEVGLATIAEAERSRNVILDEATIRAIIAAAHAADSNFGILLEVAAVTGARISQIARLECQDLQDGRADPRLMMPTSKKGKGKKVGRRPVPIPPNLAARLRALADGRSADAPLLRKPSGERWAKSDHSRLFHRAAEAAGQDPTIVTMYALRHSNIVRQLLGNVPIRIVATNHDTSVAMIERTYSRYIGDHSDALSRGALFDTTTPAEPVPPAEAEPAALEAAAGNVVQMRRHLLS